MNRTLRTLICAAGVALMPVAVPAADGSRQLYPEFKLSEREMFASFAKARRYWPKEVTLRYALSVKLRERDGTVVGSATLARGLVFRLVKVNTDGTLDLQRGSICCTVDHVATTFIESWGK